MSGEHLDVAVELHRISPSMGSLISVESGITHITTKSEREGKRRVFNINDIYRYGSIESTYLNQHTRKERIENAKEVMKTRDAYFMSEADVKMIKKAFRLQLGTDDASTTELDLTDYKIKLCKTFIPISKAENERRLTTVGHRKQTDKILCDFCHEPEDNGIHKLSRSKPMGTKWDLATHCSKVTTKCFGHIEFRYTNRAHFMRLSDDTSLPKVVDMMIDYWGMKPPGVIMALIGSVSSVELPEKFERVIQKALVKSTAACGGWVTSPGVNGGCVRHVGNGVRSYGVSLETLGIASWGQLTRGVRTRFDREDTGDFPKIVTYPKQQNNDPTHLEPFHTHFLLIDNGRKGLDSVEACTAFRTRLEEFIRDKFSIPVISVVLKGGHRTMELVAGRLEDGDPMIILHKSGGCASTIGRCLKHAKKVKDHRQVGGTRNPWMKKTAINKQAEGDDTCKCFQLGEYSRDCSYTERKINKHMRIHSEEQRDRYKDIIMDCVKNSKSVFLYNIRDAEDSFDKLLLDSMVQYSKAGIDKKLKFAFELGTVAVMESMLSEITADQIENQTIALLVMKAIILNRPKLVDLFLASSNVIHDVQVNLPILYDSSCYVFGGSHISRLLGYHLGVRVSHKNPTLHVFGTDGDTTWRQGAIDTIDSLINDLTGQSFQSSVGAEEDPYLELTIWSVMMLRKEMALVFCAKSGDPIRCALICLKILLQLQQRKNVLINSEEEEKAEGLRAALESLAVCTLEACYQEHPEFTFAASSSKWQRVKMYDYLELAYEAECKKFMAHPACQDISEKRWRVGFLKDEGFLKVMLIVVLPFCILIPGLIEFSQYANYHQDGRRRAWWDRLFVRMKIIGKSPMIKFWMNCVLWFGFVALFLDVLYRELKPVNEGSWIPIYILLVWFCILVFDEVVQVVREKPYYWWKNVWNRIDLVCFTFFIIGLTLCMAFMCTDGTGCRVDSINNTMSCDATVEGYGGCSADAVDIVHAGRIILSLVTILLFMRTFVFITNDLVLGPIVLMLQEMVGTFFNFFLIFSLIMFGFGAAYMGLVVEAGNFNPETNIIGIVYYTYFQAYGELFLENVEQPNSLYMNNNDGEAENWYLLSATNTSYYAFAMAVLVIYMVISNLMLLNVLIAMFTDSYTKISENQKVIWKFQRYGLLRDYERKFLPPPLSVVHYLLWLLRRLWKIKNPRTVYEKPTKNVDTHLRSFVREGLQSYFKQSGYQGATQSEDMFEKYSSGLN